MRTASLLSMVLVATAISFAIADDPPSDVCKTSGAIAEPTGAQHAPAQETAAQKTAAQKKTAPSRRVLEKLQLDHSHRDRQGDAAQVCVVRTYALKGFPVWSADGEKFDASILIALIKSKVIPGQWDDDRNKILPYTERTALVISTTQSAHEAIADILEELRQHLK